MAPNNALPIHGNEKTMNLNSMVLTNIQASPYFKVNLYELKTYHQVIDEIFYKVNHLEPWEKGSRKTAGQTGMCGGVRGVGAGGIVSSAYCLLYKLYTLKLTRKQLQGLCTHADSPYIRGIGLMYIRYTQPPSDFWGWYEQFLDDTDELDVKAGGGHTITVGEMCRQLLVKLEWYSTLFPRIPVPIQKQIEHNLLSYDATHHGSSTRPMQTSSMQDVGQTGEEPGFGEAERHSRMRGSDSVKSVSDVDRERYRQPTGAYTERHSSKSSHHTHSHRSQSPSDRGHSSHRLQSHHRSPSDRGHSSHRRHRDQSGSPSERRKKISDRSRDQHKRHSRSTERHDDDRQRRSTSRDKHRHQRSRSRERHKEDGSSRRGRDHESETRSRDAKRETSFERDLRKERERQLK